MKYIICEKLAALWGKLTANRLPVRLLALLLALVLLQGDFMLPAYATESEGSDTSTQTSTPETNVPSVQEQAEQAELPVDEDTLVITLDGVETSVLELFEYEKVEIRAEGLEQQADYQWQILHPENGTWVNIYDATEQSISVSAALVKNMLNEDGTAALRCRAYTEEYAYLTDGIRVTLLEEPETASVQLFSLEDEAVPMAEGDTTPEFVTVTIEYIRYMYILQDDNTFKEENVGTAFTSYIAALKSGTDLNTTVPCPTIVGYQAYLVDGETKTACTSVAVNLTNIKEDVLYTVEYHPAEVNYEVRYFFQNIYDDLYVEDTTIVNSNGITQYPITAQGITGLRPDATHTEATFAGFTSLYYEPETIAADGSTVFHVYYERNYYLMEFDCNEGYGTDTVYVRYGTYISVPNPVRAGWVFQGWDLIKTEDPSNTTALGTAVLDENNNPTGFYTGDGTKNDLPATMPPYNSAYKALWTQADTTYTIAYWIKGSDDKNTFLGSRTEAAQSGDTVSGANDLDGKLICDLSEHAHTNDCISCGHIHASSCVSSYTNKGTSLSGNDALAVAEIDLQPESGFVYTIDASDVNGDTNIYYYTYFLGNWYYMGMNNTNFISGDCLATGEYDTGNGNWISKKYYAKYSCNHAHNSSHIINCPLPEHVHLTDECYGNTQNFIYDASATDTNIIVEGDGSTVVNVYYSYKLYTLRFYYARSTGTGDSSVYSVVGGTTYKFGALGDYSNYSTEQLLANVTDWGAVQALPTINSNYTNRYVTGNTTYGSYTYYYLEFTAAYGSVLENLWPIGIFNSVKIDETHNQCSYDEAYFSAWNGEYRVKYTQDHKSSADGNETIKGLYMYLDENIIFDRQFTEVAHTDTQGNSTSLVSFLGFWDNGANISWSIPRLYEYNLMIESFAEKTDYYYNGKYYDLYKSFDTYDNSTFDQLYNQTVTSIAGLEYVGQEFVGINTDYTDDVMDECQLYFYYDRMDYDLKFWNHNEYLTIDDYSISDLKYGTPLVEYANGNDKEGDEAKEGASDLVVKSESYPEGLEPGAYEFDGWYTTAACLPGTKVEWSTLTMPDNDLTVYAYWKPVIRNVYFYYDYANYAHAKTVNFTESNDFWFHTENGVQVPEEYPIEVEHGALVGTTYSNIPDAQEGYTFVGWFYMDENNKKRFAPDSMEVKRDLHLFAEWQSGIDTQYTVTYVLENEMTVDGTTYSAGYSIANKTTGHLTAGKTKTFTAKVGTDLLYPFSEKSLFPSINSHSILMDQDMSKNTYEFTYVYDDEVYYRVRYVDKITGLDLEPSKVSKSTKAIVTEKFVPVEGYIPENYYIRKVLASDGTDGSETNVSELNEIIFYYNPDSTHGIYVIEYYTPVLGATDAQLYNGDKPIMFLGDDETIPSPYWKLEQSAIGTADLLDAEGNANTIQVTLDKDKFTGFSYDRSTITTYTEEGTASVTVDQTSSTQVSGEVSQNGLEIRIYYKRNSYDYVIEFVEYGTGTLLGYGQLDSDGAIKLNTDGTKVFEQDGGQKTAYKSTINYEAPDTIEQIVDGTKIKYLFFTTDDKPQTQSLIIDASNTETVNEVVTKRTTNVLTFYYQARTVGFYYEAVCTAVDATDFGIVSLNYESAVTAKNIAGSTAIAGDGFEFVGWYSDKNCTTQISTEFTYKPTAIPDNADTVTYYALFKPITTNLTITKTVVTDGLPDGMANDDTFLFYVKGQGKHEYLELTVAITVTSGTGSVTIDNIPLDDYTVTELTGWSWEYALDGTAAQNITLVSTPTNVVAFTNEYANPDWLGGESAVADNNFN